MDIFKLLSRSSNLQKSGHTTANVSKQVVPSTGLPAQGDPQSIQGDNAQTSDEKNELQGTKRKRSKNGNYSKLDNPDGLHAKANGERDHVGGGPFLKERVDDDFCANTKSVEDRRQRLKRNKLKVVVLDDRWPAKVSASSQVEIPTSGKKKESRPQIYPEPLISFEQLRTQYKISKRLGENLDAQGYQYPTEVQVGSLPMLLGSDEERGLAIHEPSQIKKSKCKSSHLDLLTVAPTGSGKTLAFMVNVIHCLVEGRQSIRNMDVKRSVDHQLQALILAPTHELADQIVNEGRKLAHGTGLKVSAMKKGMALDIDSSITQVQEAENSGSEDQEASTDGEPPSLRPIIKADILVSTPMLLVNAISRNRSRPSSPLPSVRYLVLDEADVLLDPLFRDQTLRIWNACVHPSLQTSLWSATIGSSIESLAQSVILDRRRELGISSPHYFVRVVVGLKDSAVPNIAHRLVYAATEQGKLLALRQLLHPTAPSEDKGPPLRPPFLVFTQTIQRAVALHSELLYDIPPEAGGSARIAVLHSDCSDSVRSAIMAGFRKGEIWVLITTDLLSRGIDFRGMNGVVNYDIPTTGASYVHRVGRTGRQGREGGVAVTLYTKEDIAYVKNIANVIAAGEKAGVKGGGKSNGNEGTQKWLLDALPRVSKKTKRELKQKGVESRRAPVDGTREKEKRRARISTKSGYDRKLEHRRKGAAQGARSRESPSASEDEWSGIED